MSVKSMFLSISKEKANYKKREQEEEKEKEMKKKKINGDLNLDSDPLGKKLKIKKQKKCWFSLDVFLLQWRAFCGSPLSVGTGEGLALTRSLAF